MAELCFETKSPKETQKIAKLLVKELLKLSPKKQALVLALSGELGSGKTTFIQGFAKGLGIRDKIQSPTFVVVKSYRLQVKSYKNLYHIDAYRLSKPREILTLCWKELVKNSKNIIAIEWAKNIEKILPQNHIDIKFDFISKNKRSINIYVR